MSSRQLQRSAAFALGSLVRASVVICTLMKVMTVLAGEDLIHIKIVEAPALSRFPSMPSPHDKKLTLRAKPSPLSGPPHLQQLSDKCYTAKDKGYTYDVCMFQNITQEEERVGWNSFHGVLGVWHEWIVENDTFTGMHYTMGDACGSSDRESMVILNCSASTKLHSFKEPQTCHYHMVLDTPLACFQGAMQVYHLLSAEQLKKWDEIDHLYFAEEITHKGRTKRRRKLLMEAGLLQEAKKVEVTTPVPETHHQAAKNDHSRTLANLTQCVGDRDRLRKELQDMKNAALRIVKDSPELHYKMGLVFNHSGSHSPPAEDQAGGKGGVVGGLNEEEEDKGEEVLLSDEVMDTLARDLESVNGDGVISEKKVDRRVSDGKEGLEGLLENMDIHDLYNLDQT